MLKHNVNNIVLDGECLITKESWVVIYRGNEEIVIFQPESMHFGSMAGYGLSGTATMVGLPSGKSWLKPEHLDKPEHFINLRETVIYTDTEELNIAEMPISKDICNQKGSDPIEIINYDGNLILPKKLIIKGETKEKEQTEGVIESSLVILESIKPTEDGKAYILTLASELKNCYKRETVRIYGNVVKATHGETRSEVLGSGDASKPLQAFTLKQPPLTYTAASNPSGVDSTLQVYVNDLRWHEADALAGLAPTDRKFITLTDNENKTILTFGNGQHGARLPTGIENIRAEYRNGIGKAGNVQAGRITELVDRLPGLKEVTNPQPATGGADRDSIAQLRRNAPLAVQALDRLVSVQDYEDFTRLFAGIGKACAVEIADGRRQLVHITIAGVDDAEISTDSDLYRNLLRALRKSGDPYQAIQVDICERKLLVISAKVSILPDYRWEAVREQIRAALLEAFSFENR